MVKYIENKFMVWENDKPLHRTLLKYLGVEEYIVVPPVEIIAPYAFSCTTIKEVYLPPTIEIVHRNTPTHNERTL